MKALGDRMKNYEASFGQRLPDNLPVIIRVDGRAFSTWTEGLEEPFSDPFRNVMAATMTSLCEEFHGTKIGYTQSDEISLVLTNHDDIDTEPVFDNDVLKLASVAASEAAALFNRFWEETPTGQAHNPRPASFDGRAFVVPNHEEVVNYLLWRQRDWERNSLNALARAHYSAKELEGKGREERHDMLHEKGVNWNDVDTAHKRGIFARRVPVDEVVEHASPHPRHRQTSAGWTWDTDWQPPVLTQDRDYVREVLPESMDPGKEDNDPPIEVTA